MPLLSVQITPTLHKSLKQKAKDMGGLKMSDAVRILLQKALDTTGQSHYAQEPKLQQQLLHYNITSYYMLQAHLLNSFEEGQQLNDSAHKKASAVLEKLSKKHL